MNTTHIVNSQLDFNLTPERTDSKLLNNVLIDAPGFSVILCRFLPASLLFYNIYTFFFFKSIHPDTFHKKSHVDRPYLREVTSRTD